MPSALALESLGLFVRPEFLSTAECARLVATMNAGAGRKGTVATDEDTQQLNENVRRVWCSDVGRTTAIEVGKQLWRLKPDLEAHFGPELADFEGPDFLVYEPGAFYTAHRDIGTHYETRAVSVTLFLNGHGTGDGYEGGELTFYGLLDGPHWKNCPIAVAGTPGLLLAFRSDTLHEVRPVTSGRRCSAVGWFSRRP